MDHRCRTVISVFLLLYLALPISGQAWVRLPASYTAMKGDIVVSFDLSNSSHSNSVVHVEAVETGNRLSELPIPIGLTSGAVIFPCGVIVHGGPHRAVLTKGGKVRAIFIKWELFWSYKYFLGKSAHICTSNLSNLISKNYCKIFLVLSPPQFCITPLCNSPIALA